MDEIEEKELLEEIKKQEKRFKGFVIFLKVALITLGILVLLMGGCLFIVLRNVPA